MQKITQKELLEKVRDNHKKVSTQARLKKKKSLKGTLPPQWGLAKNKTLEKGHDIGHTMGTRAGHFTQQYRSGAYKCTNKYLLIGKKKKKLPSGHMFHKKKKFTT